MKFDYKFIHLGNLIEKKVIENDIELTRICNFLNCTDVEVNEMYQKKNIDTELLLKWSKLLEYDFFRLYSQHLILYSPPKSINYNKINIKSSVLPVFRKNLYTIELIQFILDQLKLNIISKKQIIEEYNIPKETLYKWIKKYN